MAVPRDAGPVTQPGTTIAPSLGGAGSNPSTWVGIWVLASVAGLAMIRRSFRRMS
jgi:MYXO-CTERM domain-containing protein